MGDETALWWVLVLFVVAVAGWCGLQRQVAGGRWVGVLPADAVGDGDGVDGPAARAAEAVVRWSGGLRQAVRGRPELLLLPVGAAAGWATGSPVPVLVAVVAVLPAGRWRRRRAVAAEARDRAVAVMELCAGLAGELRVGATPEQALHLVTARIAADSVTLGRLGAEPVARLAAGRYGADVPAAFRLLAELPGGSGAAAVAACWRTSSAGGAGLAAGLDGVAEALRTERALAEEIAAELAAPRTTVAVLAALPPAGLLLGTALGARPLEVLLHTPAGLGFLTVGAVLEGLGLVWTARIVRSAVQDAVLCTSGRRVAPPPTASGGDVPDRVREWLRGDTPAGTRPDRPAGALRRETTPG
ncbi:type II secretion system F family protein [Kitasatospora sp. NPDC056327]|uniref:type II secretion system F family protein n=1 Tax=Kitasatospora sp. NPDC056327 TaxID=3345785 RepID=UPI0035D7F2B7